MTQVKISERIIAFAMAFVLATAGFVVTPSAHASETPEPNLQVASMQAQGPDLLPSGGVQAPRSLKVQQDQSDMTIFGVDVSQWQGSINWEKAATTVKFAIVRCGYGSDLRNQDDSKWAANVKGCHDNNIPMGVYLYSYAKNTTMAKSEASHVIRCLSEAGLNATTLELPIYLDMEDASTAKLKSDKYLSIFTAFKEKLNAAGYANVGIYANSDWWSNRLTGIELSEELRWVAQWGTLFAGYPDVAEKGCGLWQYTNGAKVSGISGSVDGDYAKTDWPFLDGLVAPDPEPVALHVLYRKKTRDYQYTTSDAVRDSLVAKGWKRKADLGRVPVTSTKPVYQLYNKKKKAHYYTLSAAKYDQLKAQKKWKGQGIAFYSHLKKGGKKVFRFSKAGKYRYSYSKKIKGWKRGGVAWYVVK